MPTVYLVDFPKEWNIDPRIYLTRIEIKELVRELAKAAEAKVSRQERQELKEEISERLYLEKCRALSAQDKKAELERLTKDRFCKDEDFEIETQVEIQLLIQRIDAWYKRIEPSIREIDIEKADMDELRQIESIYKQFGSPDAKIIEAVEFRKNVMSWKNGAKLYYNI